MTKKISVARALHFPKTADCKKLSKTQLEALATLSCRHGPRKERLVSRLPYQYQTLEALVERRLAKFRCLRRGKGGTNKFMYVCITELGQQITNLRSHLMDEELVLGSVHANAVHVLRNVEAGMRHLGVQIPEKKQR